VHKTGSIKVASGKDAADDTDDDTDMGFSEPAMDDGDGPSTSHTNAFNKKQAVITNSAGLDGEL
jgi:hypothetical protein